MLPLSYIYSHPFLGSPHSLFQFYHPKKSSMNYSHQHYHHQKLSITTTIIELSLPFQN